MESKMKFEITSSQLSQILAALKKSVVPGINQDSSVPALQGETQHSFTAGSTAPVPIRIPPPPPIAPPSFSTIAELKALDSLNSYHSDPDMAAMQIKNFVEECTSQGRQDDPQSEEEPFSLESGRPKSGKGLFAYRSGYPKAKGIETVC